MCTTLLQSFDGIFSIHIVSPDPQNAHLSEMRYFIETVGKLFPL